MRILLPNTGSDLFRKTTILLTVLLSTTIFSCQTGDDAANSNKSTSSFSVPKPRISANSPLKVSERAADKELCRAVGEEIDKRNAAGENWGVIAVGLSDGRAACSRNPRQLFLPASIQKLITAAASFDKLGPEYKFKTSLYGKSGAKNGNLEGDLVFYGRGAPDLDKKSIADLVAQLHKKGIKNISGDVIGDESYFKGDGLGDGWTWNEAQWYYGAAASALSFERNQITVTIKNGKPYADSELVELSGELKPVESIEAVGIKRKLGTNEVYVWGNGKDLKARIAVSDPAMFAARVLKESLEKSGIAVAGKSRTANWKKPTYTGGLLELASVESERLSDIVRTMNRDSVNLYAELLLRILGKKFGDKAPDSNPKMNLLRGDDRAGASVVKKWIADNGLADGSTAVHDGSGLSMLDRVSPELIARVLMFSAQNKFAQAFSDSLPVAGESGTLRRRLNGVKGKIAAKTGSIKYVNSLAGYAKKGKETYAFVIICNDETTRNDSTATIDNIAALFTGADSG